MMARLVFIPVSVSALAMALAVPAYGQDVSGSDDSAAEVSPRKSTAHGKNTGRGRLKITPYIEAAQVLTKEFSPDNETLTYTRLAAGVDAQIDGRNTSAALSLRYEHQIGWGNADDADTLSGLARGSIAIIPKTLTFEVGGMAARTRTDDNGGTLLGGVGRGDDVGHLYSAYAGPSLTTRVGDVAIDAAYRFGYSRVDLPNSYIIGADGRNADESTQHAARFRAGVRPGDVLPVGLAVEGAWQREDMASFDQRIDDSHIRGEVTMPVSHSVALVGGIGYEKVKVSERDVVRDGAGKPVLDKDGHYRLDKHAPRQIAYDVDGLIWDVGLIWRPSPRTSLEGHYGRRYGSPTYYGSFNWQPSHRSSVNVSVYDSMSGFGGQLNRALVSLPTDFEAIRDPITGDLNSCVGSLKEGNCLTGALGALRSSTFRARGISASYAVQMGRINTGIGIGYEQRKYIAARDSVLGGLDGIKDKNLWLSAYLSARLSEQSLISAQTYANRYKSGLDIDGDGYGVGASLAYQRMLTRRLSATAAIGIDGYTRKVLEDYWIASALLGLRYSF